MMMIMSVINIVNFKNVCTSDDDNECNKYSKL